MKYSLTLIAALALCGCAFDGQLQNRIATTLDCKRAFMASLYGPIGITAEIDKADVDVLCGKVVPASAPASAVK